MEEAIFQVDGIEGEFVGWHDPSVRWNGFAVPFFSKESADKLIQEINKTGHYIASYNHGEDSYRINEINAERFTSNMLPIKATNIDTKTGKVIAYPIGGWNWCWSTTEDFL